MKNVNNFTQWKNGSVDVTFARSIMHQKHLVQSGCSSRSAVDIFNTLRVFPKEPIRKQEIELECVNYNQNEISFCNISAKPKKTKQTTLATKPKPIAAPKISSQGSDSESEFSANMAKIASWGQAEG